MPNVFDWAYFLLGLLTGVGMEAAIGAFVTAPLAVWWLRRKKDELIRDFLEDDESVALIREKLVNAAFGQFGGRPVSLKKMGKAAVGMGAQMAMPIILQKGLGFLGVVNGKAKKKKKRTPLGAKASVPKGAASDPSSEPERSADSRDSNSPEPSTE